MYAFLTTFILLWIDPGFWHNLYVNGPVRVIAVAGTVTILLQLIKRQFPTLGGWYAVAINAGLSIAGILAVTPPDQFWTVTTWGQVIQAIGVAAGIHGTAKALSSPSPAPPASIPGVKNVAIAALISILMLGSTGCQSFERTTFQSLAASQSLVNGAYEAYEARTITRTQTAHDLVEKARAAQTAAVQAMVTYEQIKFAKGTQSALDAQAAIVATALQALPAIIADIKALLPATAEIYPPSYKLPSFDAADQALYELQRPLSAAE